MSLVALVVALWLQAPAPPPAPDTGWLGVQAGVVEVAFAHDHGGARLDGGLLTVDPNRRLVLWQGISGPLGCPDRIEARFDDVRRVEAADGPGLRVQFHKPIGRTLLLIPRPHARWLRERPRVIDPLTMTQVANESDTGPDGREIKFIGDMVTVAPIIQRIDLPREVTADTRIAVDAIREALGRTVAPGAALHEALHGTPRDLQLAEILAAPADHQGHAVRTVGVVARPPSGDGATDLIAGGLTLLVQPAREVTKLWTALARTWVGREVEVTGVLGRGPREGVRVPAPTLSVWDFAPTDQAAPAGDVRAAGLGDVVEGKQGQGDLVRVVGLFRGRNLFGDMEGRSPDGRAWVLKSGAHAVWIVGKPPSGPGWTLDPDDPQDATYWLEVVGRVSRHRGRARIHARSVALTTPPPEAPVAAAPPQVRLVTGMSANPPVVVFALPMDGETELPPDTRFVVQFSKYMDAASFPGRVRVRHAGGEAAVRELPNVRLAYDDSRRALVVDPGEVLEAGAQVECVLLPGIADQQGIALAPRPGRREEGAVDVLRFGIAR